MGGGYKQLKLLWSGEKIKLIGCNSGVMDYRKQQRALGGLDRI